MFERNRNQATSRINNASVEKETAKTMAQREKNKQRKKNLKNYAERIAIAPSLARSVCSSNAQTNSSIYQNANKFYLFSLYFLHQIPFAYMKKSEATVAALGKEE